MVIGQNIQLAIAGFEDGRGSTSQGLASGKGKKTDSPPDPSERT